MNRFNENLQTLDNSDHLKQIDLYFSDGKLEGTIYNQPGSQGSVKVYHHLFKIWGCIDAQSAKEGLDLYAEHTQDARENPGKHPNIDRLFNLIESNEKLSVTLVVA